MPQFDKFLAGDDLRKLGKTSVVISQINTRHNFDQLFQLLYHEDRILVMRAADAIEKITKSRSDYLSKYKNQLLELCGQAKNKELIWHLALLLPRLQLKNKEFDKAWNLLIRWAKDRANSRIVRVNAIQALFEMTSLNPARQKNLDLLLLELAKENIPSVNARIRKIRKVWEVNTNPRPGRPS